MLPSLEELRVIFEALPNPRGPRSFAIEVLRLWQASEDAHLGRLTVLADENERLRREAGIQQAGLMLADELRNRERGLKLMVPDEVAARYEEWPENGQETPPA